MNINVGFIGAGNMGSAMITGIVKNGLIPADRIFVSEINKARHPELKANLGVEILDSNEQLIKKCDVIILAVKPNMVKEVLEENKNFFDNKKILASVAVGIPIKFYKSILGEDRKIIRTMPNTPALIGEGMTAMSFDSFVTAEEGALVKKILQCFSKVEIIDEKLMNTVAAVSGSSPAFVYMFIEALSDAAVRGGLPRDMSYTFAAQAVQGAARMVMETGKHPGELKDQVCSPGGTTIVAVAELEKNGMRNAVISAVNECIIKSIEIGKVFE